MSSAPSIPASPNMPATDVPSEEIVERHASAPFDAQMIAQMANAFFQLQPHQVPPAPIAPGVPIVAPLAPDIPAPSVVTTVAPYAPARPSYGPPDVPPTTIPSVVPTPVFAAPAAPTNAQPGSRPLGMPDPPQPGASVGAMETDAPSTIDYASIPRLFGEGLALERREDSAPQLAPAPAPIPGGSSPSRADNLYFLQERSSVGAPSSAPSGRPGEPRFEQPPASYSGPGSAPAAYPTAAQAYPIAPASYPAAPASYPDAPSTYPSTPASAGASPGEAFTIPAPSQSDPHRLSDAASLASPPAPAPGFEGFDSALSPAPRGRRRATRCISRRMAAGIRASSRRFPLSPGRRGRAIRRSSPRARLRRPSLSIPIA